MPEGRQSMRVHEPDDDPSADHQDDGHVASDRLAGDRLASDRLDDGCQNEDLNEDLNENLNEDCLSDDTVAPPALATTVGGDFSCPVCGADQPPAAECRRCRADLAMFLKFWSDVSEKRMECLALLRQRRLLRATRVALECVELSAEDRNLRLLASCYVLQGDFTSAIHTMAKTD